MRRPIQSVIDSGNGSPRRQAVIIGGVIALHAVLGYAIVSGLAQRIVLEAPNILTAEVLPQQEVPPPPQPLPLKPDALLKPTAAPPAPVPVIRIAPTKPAHSITVVQGPPRPVTPAPRVVVEAPPAPVPEPAPVIAPTAARSVAGTHTIPPYPDLARRLGESGTVRIQVALDEAGIIRAVTVVRSSGSDRLDQAAASWVQAHWRYEPATRNGQPVASSLLAEVVFDLKNAR